MKFDLIIAAAGKGSRLSVNVPKPLFEINNKPLLQIVIEKFNINLNKIIIVVSNETKENFEMFVNKILRKEDFQKFRFEIVVQQKLNGTLGAVKTGLKFVEEDKLFIAWGDHVGISENMVNRMVENAKKQQENSLILPTVLRTNPYINFKRYENKIVEFQENKNFENKIPFGENDCGCFLLDKQSLISSIKEFQFKNLNLAREVNFLEIIPILETKKKGIYTQVETDLRLTMGINTLEDARNYSKNNFEMNM